jgi:CHAT domain-containing protein
VFMGGDEHGLEKQLANVTGRLYELVFAPLEKSATIDAQVFISPDGQLSLLPFEILPLPDGRYAIEQYEFTYLSSGRDLLKHPEEHPGQASGAIVVAAPDYDMEQLQPYAQVDAGGDRALLDRFRGPSDRTECLSVPFDPLPAAEKEGQMVSNLFKDRLGEKAVLLTGPTASEDSLKHLSHPPRVLHLATHGYFCSKASYSDVSKMTESPLLYSGLALAGSNRTIENPGR